jgi:hypothetical protein
MRDTSELLSQVAEAMAWSHIATAAGAQLATLKDKLREPPISDVFITSLQSHVGPDELMALQYLNAQWRAAIADDTLDQLMPIARHISTLIEQITTTKGGNPQ